MTQNEIDALLYSQADEKYREFNAKIVNTRLPMIGVRTPYLQKLAKNIARNDIDFFDTYSPNGYEQILLYALTAAYARAPIEEKFDRLDKVLPLFDNWAHVDLTVGAFKDLGKHKNEFMTRYSYLVSAPEFQRRFMVIFLMSYCMSAEELPTVFGLYERMQCDDYYVNMGIAWGLSVALVKFYDQTVEFLTKNTFNDFIVRKTVQKARESYRISDERKRELKTMFSR